MTEKRLHFNKFGIMTAKLSLITEGETDVYEAFINAHKNTLVSYFENEYSANADDKYESLSGIRKSFRPFELIAVYTVSGESQKRIISQITSYSKDGEKSEIVSEYKCISLFGEIFFRGVKKRKRVGKTI